MAVSGDVGLVCPECCMSSLRDWRRNVQHCAEQAERGRVLGWPADVVKAWEDRKLNAERRVAAILRELAA